MLIRIKVAVTWFCHTGVEMASFGDPLFPKKSLEVSLYGTQMKTQIEFLRIVAKNNKDKKEIWRHY